MSFLSLGQSVEVFKSPISSRREVSDRLANTTLVDRGVLAVRVSLAIGLAGSIAFGSAAIAVLVAAVIVADLADGFIARAMNSDSDRRRLWDSLVDRGTIHLALIAWMVANQQFLALYVVLVLRDLAVYWIAERSLREQALLLKVGGWHRLSTLSVAAWGLALAYASSDAIALAGATCAVINCLTMMDYVGGLRMARRSATRDSRLELDSFDGLRALFFGIRAPIQPSIAALTNSAQRD